MDTPRASSPRPASEVQPAQLAKAALRRLVLDKLEPTPENYARAYQQEAGGAVASAASSAPSGALPAAATAVLEKLAHRALPGLDAARQRELSQVLAAGDWAGAEAWLQRQPSLGGESSAEQATALATLIERIVRGVQQGGRQWTSARKKDSLQRVLSSSRSDAKRLHQRLGQLVTSWETDRPDEAVETDAAPLDAALDAITEAVPSLSRGASEIERIRLDVGAEDARGADVTDAPSAAQSVRAGEGGSLASPHPAQWHAALSSLESCVLHALPPPPTPSSELAQELQAWVRSVPPDGPNQAQAESLDDLCQRANRALAHRHYLVDQLSGLVENLTASLTDLAEDDSWAQGQCEAMRQEMSFGLTARSVRSVIEMLDATRQRQQSLRVERAKARDALKALINQMLGELGELGSHTSRFHENLGRYAGVIEQADSLESLAGAVREMVEESRTVQSLVSQAQGRLNYEHERATGLSDRVAELETELRRLSQEVSTDQLTKIANRRGLLQVFDTERAREQRDGSPLSIGLLDIDNFKRLNDELGHGAGDEALKALSAVVSKTLRPTDLVARYGGEEFVVLLPNTPADEAAQILTRLQRSLSGGLFMHEQKQVFVTFSAGVTLYRSGERIEVALERADVALYEAKHSGKNRTCVG